MLIIYLNISEKKDRDTNTGLGTTFPLRIWLNMFATSNRATLYMVDKDHLDQPSFSSVGMNTSDFRYTPVILLVILLSGEQLLKERMKKTPIIIYKRSSKKTSMRTRLLN